jgi:hypothetical protein
MKKQYRKVTAASVRTLKELGIPKAKIERQQEILYNSKFRPQPEVKVHLDQGVVKRWKYVVRTLTLAVSLGVSVSVGVSNQTKPKPPQHSTQNGTH